MPLNKTVAKEPSDNDYNQGVGERRAELAAVTIRLNKECFAKIYASAYVWLQPLQQQWIKKA